MKDLDDLMAELKTTSDELRVKMHLASKEVQDEWNELEGKLQYLADNAGIGETGEGVGKALGQLGHELKLGYERIRDAVRDA